MVFSFDDCRLDIERRELRRQGECVDLAPKVFDLLTFLVQHRDRVVTKDDLLQAVWGGRIVSESALTTRINAVRRAIGDDGAAQRLVRTFARKGVRFIGDVAEIPDPENSDASDAIRPAPPLPEKTSLVVLPFQNMSGDPKQEYFVDGIVEEITVAISRFPWLFVIARNSAFTYKDKAVDVRQVARELGVRYVLEGSVRKAGNRVRITGQLIDAASGAHLWADRFDGSLDDIFELQDEVASRVVGAIEPKLRFIETDRVSHKPTENLDAYDLYLRALAQTYKPLTTGEAVAESIRLCRRALELDPSFAPAMARLAGSRTIQLHRHWIPESGAEAEEGIHLARQALAVAKDNPEVLRLAGFALAGLAGENETALAALDRAIELNPNYAFAYAQRGIVLTYLNRPDEAISAAERAIRLSPNDPSVFNFYLALGLAHLAAGRYEEALPWADRAVAADARLACLRLKLSLCGYLSRREAASECLQRLREIIPEPTVAIVMRDVVKAFSAELTARIAEGLRKAGLPEE